MKVKAFQTDANILIVHFENTINLINPEAKAETDHRNEKFISFTNKIVCIYMIVLSWTTPYNIVPRPCFGLYTISINFRCYRKLYN